MILTVMQPAYLPWLGYFDRIVKSDHFVLLDHVSMDRNSRTKFANRNRIRTPEGATWLTVPIMTSGHQGNCPINQVRIASDAPWRRKHGASIRENYARATFLGEHRDFIDDTYGREWDTLDSLCEHLLSWMLSVLGIRVPVARSSEMGLESTGSELILDICRHMGAEKYISGPFGREYLDHQAFEEEAVELVFHDYPHPQYEQSWGGFESHLSCLDLILNHGGEGLEILTSQSSSLAAR